jgi:hypothetical protein
LALVGSVLGVSGVASAGNVATSPRWCRHHPHSARPACRKTAGAAPSGGNLTVSPDPVVETGDSDVYGVLSVETGPVYAEQTVEIDSALANRCGQGVTWISDLGTFSGSTADAVIDDDGNATLTFLGGACAAGSVEVVADVEAGSDPTYTASFTIDPPAPLI